MLEYYIGMQGFYKFHQISLLCDHQELACTPKDPPRQVDMNEMSLICFYITKMIELSTKMFENLLFRTCWHGAFLLLYLNKNAYAKYKNAKFETSRVGQVPAMPLRNIKLRQLKK